MMMMIIIIDNNEVNVIPQSPMFEENVYYKALVDHLKMAIYQPLWDRLVRERVAY